MPRTKQSGENARSWIVTTNGSSPVRSVALSAVHPDADVAPVPPVAPVDPPLSSPPLLHAAPASAVRATTATRVLRMIRLRSFRLGLVGRDEHSGVAECPRWRVGYDGPDVPGSPDPTQ